MIRIKEALLGSVVALARGIRVDGVLAPVFSPVLVIGEDGEPLPVEQQPPQPTGKINGGVQPDRGDGARVIVEFDGAGWADVPLQHLEMREPGRFQPRTLADQHAGGALDGAGNESALIDAIAEIGRLRGVVEMLTADKEQRDERAKTASDPGKRFISVDDVAKMIDKRAEAIAESKVSKVREDLGALVKEHVETRGRADKASDDAAHALASSDAARQALAAGLSAVVNDENTPADVRAALRPLVEGESAQLGLPGVADDKKTA